MAVCNSQRVLIVLVVVLAIVAVVAVGVLIWRETRDEEKQQLTSENLQKVYSSHFRTDIQQKFFEQKYIEGIANRTVVRDKIPSVNGSCVFSCFGNAPAKRRKRQALGGASTSHGCCVSTVGFVSPSTKSNIFGQSRTFVQLTDLKQHFAEHQCQSVSGCTGCVCSQEGNLHTAVVVKTSVTVAEFVDDTETDFFFFDGCCKCVNN